MPTSKPHRIPISPLQWKPDDALATEYGLVSKLISETLATGWKYYTELDLETTTPGKEILAASPEAVARMVLVLVANCNHYDGLQRRVKALAAGEMERINWHHTPEWEAVWPPRQICAQTLRRLLRRKLPLSADHLIKLADWIATAEWLNDTIHPLKAFVKAVENFGDIPPDAAALRASLSRLAELLRNSHDKQLPKLAREIEARLGGAGLLPSKTTDEAEKPRRSAGDDPSKPAPTGDPHVMVQLKQFLKLLPQDEVAGMEIGFDHFTLRDDSPLREEHEAINMFLPEVIEKPGYHDVNLLKDGVGRAMLARDPSGRARVVLALAERIVNSNFVGGGLADHRCWQSQYAIKSAFRAMLASEADFTRSDVFDLLLYFSAVGSQEWYANAECLTEFLPFVEALAKQSALNQGERHVLHRIRCRMVRACPFGKPPPEMIRINQLLNDESFIALVPGEAWSDAVNAELDAMSAANRAYWIELLEHASTATATRPSAKWLKTAKALVKNIGSKPFASALQHWLPLFNAPRTIRTLPGSFGFRPDSDGTVHEDNATCLRGVLWMVPELASPDLIRALGAVTASCYRKIPGIGPRAVKAGNAGVYALSQINDPFAVGQLALLKVKVKFGSAQKEIEKAFNAAAERSGLPREELEEMSVPTYGLTDVGVCEETMGEFTARLTITGTTTTELVWVKSDGKTQRAVPAAVKEGFKDDLKELQAAAKDIQKMLPAQRQRIDGLFLQQRTWPLTAWRERYLNHPLIGTLARRILWEFKCDGKSVTAIWFKDRLVDVDLKPVELADDKTTVELWHPIGKAAEEVAAWRSWLDEQQIQQPFKQAHREIYLLTDAERNTRVYSNRYAAHVVKQYQFNALCALRGWKNQLRLMVDAEYPPATLHLPQWGLRAEFWIEGLGTNYGADTSDSGAFLYLSTDQVRFYRVDAAQRIAHAGGGGYHTGYRQDNADALPLEEIPPLVFSEVMRDVDMFVGVASVGNDPAWSDGGPEGRYRAYWENYSFGELNASAKTRQEVLERLVPKLKIAKSCSFVDRFMVVKGTLRTYKIHLGSGNILMEPNDQYLCIVPQQGQVEEGPVLLPFEGDRTLSIILSKAFMLADDSKIKDQSIVSQIRKQ